MRDEDNSRIRRQRNKFAYRPTRPLKTAMRLEFATVPPYLCAQWSIDPDHDPDDVSDMIGNIVVQEMKHFAQVGNLLTAMGSMPDIANASFIVDYPTNELPGGIVQALAVDLKPLSQAQLAVFMQIEKPEFAPIPIQPLAEIFEAPATIGDFYDAVEAAFSALKPSIDPNAHAVVAHGVMPIKTLDDVKPAIDAIKSQGEGTTASPDQVAAGALAHYYAFEQISIGKTFTFANGRLVPGNPPIAFPTVFDFQPSAAVPRTRR